MFNFHFFRCCFKTAAAANHNDSYLVSVGVFVILWSDNPVLKPVCWIGFRRFTETPHTAYNFRSFSLLFFNSHFFRGLCRMLRCVAIFEVVACIFQYVRLDNCEDMDGHIYLCVLVGKICIIHALKSHMWLFLALRMCCDIPFPQ